MTDSSPPPAGGLARRVLAFAGLPFLTLLTPFLFLPVLARWAGPEAWVAIAIGQSVGGFAALAVSFGFNTVGPSAVALADEAERTALLRRSIHARVVLLVPVAAAACGIAVAIAPAGFGLDAALMALAQALTGLSSAWFMIGLGHARSIALFEILPRMIATLAALVPLLIWREVLGYPALLVVAGIVGVLAYAVRRMGWRGLLSREPGALRAVLRENRSAAATEIASGAYNSLAVTFVSSVATASAAATYVTGDKLYRIGQYSVSALGNALQGWVVEDARAHFRARVRRSFVLHLLLGLAGLAVFSLAGPELSALLFGPAVALDRPTAIAFGVATVGIALGTSLGRVTLVGLGARREFMLSVFAGATVGIPAVLILAGLAGAAGGAAGLALGEAVSVTAQAIVVARRLTRREP